MKKSYTPSLFWFATIMSLLPAMIFLGLDASDWPNSWDDFQRLFNGISPEHEIINYGFHASKSMMKLAVHDPVLTFSSRLRLQFPFLSILVEVVLLISPILFFSRLAYLRNEIWLCVAMSMGFSGFTLIRPNYLPPASYPLGFTLAFCLSLFVSIKLINYILYKKSPLLSIFIIVIEQMAFIFYAPCYLQSLFITLFGIFITIKLHKNLWTKKQLAILLFVQLIRFSIFPLMTFIWRLSYSASQGEGESLSSSLSLKGLIYALLKWSSGATSISYLMGWARPQLNLTDIIGSSQRLLLLFMMIFIFTICLILWRKFFTHTHQNQEISTKIKNIFFEKLNPYLTTAIIGFSITLAWCLPIVSSRYYAEMQDNSLPPYVAMRYASFGLILMITSGIGYIFKAIYRLYSTNIIIFFISCFFPFWLYTVLLNINHLYSQRGAPIGISLKTICNQEHFTSADYISLGNLVPSSVLEQGADGWLPSLDNEKNKLDGNSDNSKEIIGKVFIQNSLRLCNHPKSLVKKIIH